MEKLPEPKQKLSPSELESIVLIGLIIIIFLIIILLYNYANFNRRLPSNQSTVPIQQTNLYQLKPVKFIVNENGTNYHGHSSKEEMLNCPICKRYF